MKLLCPSSFVILAALLNQAAAESYVSETFGGGGIERCPNVYSWGGPGDYCIGGRIHWCNNPNDPANGLSNDCGGRGCQVTPRGTPDQCNPVWGNRPGGGGINAATDTYRVDAFEDLCIDITDGRLVPGQAAQVWHCNNRKKNQRFIPFSDGTIRVEADTSLCLDAYSNLSAGTPIQLWQCTGNRNQLWNLRLDIDGTIRPRSRPDLCFNIVDGNMQAGERLQLWRCTAAFNEKFLNIGSM